MHNTPTGKAVSYLLTKNNKPYNRLLFPWVDKWYRYRVNAGDARTPLECDQSPRRTSIDSVHV